jgi:twitching motility protein PilT
MHINDLLKVAVTSGASDLHLKVGSYPMMRINGSLVVASEEKRLDRPDTEAMAHALFSPEHLEKFRRSQEVDLAYSVAGLGRFRVNVFQQRGTVGPGAAGDSHAGSRRIDELGLPPVLKRIASEERGPGAGYGNHGQRQEHDARGDDRLHQRDARRAHHDGRGPDRVSASGPPLDRQPAGGRGRYPDLLARAAQRAAAGPDVILVGEMRDFETVETALLAAETGHLVFSTLHTLDATETVNRIITVFPAAPAAAGCGCSSPRCSRRQSRSACCPAPTAPAAPRRSK